ncbi:hypothetical protein B0H34DRAFT_663762, partial [Crassisporium funariophilum]
KKVKMHKCPECYKDFPRPSGLKTHMNMHTKEKPFPCTHPGCTRSFSVVSNARRHMRTHGLGLNCNGREGSSEPYIIGFEEPVVATCPIPDTRRSGKEPVRLRWVSLGSGRAPHVGRSMRVLQSADALLRSSKSSHRTNGNIDMGGKVG